MSMSTARRRKASGRDDAAASRRNRFAERRKQLQPTLDELVQRRLAEHLGIAVARHANPKRQRGTESRAERHRGRALQTDKRLRSARSIASTAIRAA